MKAILTVFLLGVALTLGEYHNCKDDPVRGIKETKLDLSILKGLDECIGHRYDKSDARYLEPTCILTLVNLSFLVNKVW